MVVRRCGGVQRACADLNYAATGFARAPRLTVLAGLASGGVGAGGSGHVPLTQKQVAAVPCAGGDVPVGGGAAAAQQPRADGIAVRAAGGGGGGGGKEPSPGAYP